MTTTDDQRASPPRQSENNGTDDPNSPVPLPFSDEESADDEEVSLISVPVDPSGEVRVLVNGNESNPNLASPSATQNVNPQYNADLVASLLQEVTDSGMSGVPTDQDLQKLAEKLSKSKRRISAAHERLRAEENREAAWYPEILAEAEAALAEADHVVDELPKDEERLHSGRKELLDGYFLLQRLIDVREGRAPSLLAKAPEKTAEEQARQAATDAVKKQVQDAFAPAAKKQRRRNIVLITIQVIAAGVIGWLLFGDQLIDPPPRPETYDEFGDTISASTQGGKKIDDAVAQGAPIVARVDLMQDNKGNLRALAQAINPLGPRPLVEFTWYQDGTLLKTEPKGIVRARDIKDGAAYKVSVVARSGSKTSPPLMTKSLVVLRKTKNQRGQ